jgi:hypothetical protein
MPGEYIPNFSLAMLEHDLGYGGEGEVEELGRCVRATDQVTARRLYLFMLSSHQFRYFETLS